MRQAFWRGCLLWALFGAMLPVVGRAQAPAPAQLTFEDFLSKAVRFEQERQWQQAADLYERAMQIGRAHV